MNLFDLMAVIRLDKSEYEQGLKDAETEAQGFGGKLKTALGTAGKVGAAAVGAIATGTAAATTAMIAGAKQTAAYGDNIDKMSQKMGISAEAYQEWDAIMQHSGTSIEALRPSMKTLAQQAEKGSDAFKKLGISEEEVANLSQEDLFARVISGLQGMEEGTERTAITAELLGRGATELGALLNTSAEDTEAMRQRVHELGGVMSDEAVKAAAAFQDSLQDMTTSFDGLKRGILGDLMPSLTTVMDGITELFSGDSENGIAIVSEGVQSMIDQISEKLPDVINVGSEIITSLLTAIIDNLPKLLVAGADGVVTITQGLIENLPTLIAAGLDVIVALADGISESLPELIPTIVDVVLQIVFTLLDNVDKLITAAGKLIIALAVGLIKAIPDLVRRVPEIITAMVKALLEGLKDIRDVGSQLLEGLWGGISDKVEWLKGKVGGVVDTIKGWFTGKSGFDEHSPSRWAADVFEKLLEGGAQGLEAGSAGLLGTVGGVVGDVQNAMQPALNGSFSATQRVAGNVGVGAGAEPINVTLTLDSITLAQLLVDPLRRVQQFNGQSYISMGGSAV